MCSGVGWQKFHCNVTERRGLSVTACIVHKEENITSPHLHDQIEPLEPFLEDDSSHPCLGVVYIGDIHARVKVGAETPRSLGLSNNQWLALVRPIGIGAECNSQSFLAFLHAPNCTCS